MSKYDRLWQYVSRQGDSFALTFEEIEERGGVPMDHSFLTCKKELMEYGYQVGKISLKGRTVSFIKTESAK